MPQLQSLIKDGATRLEFVKRTKPGAIQVLEALGVFQVYILCNGTTPAPVFLWARARTPTAPRRRCFATVHGEASDPCAGYEWGGSGVQCWLGSSPSIDASDPLLGSQSSDDGCIVPVSGETCLRPPNSPLTSR